MKSFIITGTGSYLPENVVRNREFTNKEFYDTDHVKFDKPGEEIVQKFQDITGIRERRWENTTQKTSDIAAFAGERAIRNAGVNREELDYIIVAHNFGDVEGTSMQLDIVPSIASRVKNLLNIESENCVPFDLLFGCPGWVQSLITAKAFMQSGMAEKTLVIGADMLSRVIDPYDRDSMIFADGAGATVFETRETDAPAGFLDSMDIAHTKEELEYLNMGPSFHAENGTEGKKYIKMKGRKIYEYALTKVPEAMKAILDRNNIPVEDVKKIFLHQANEKMEDAILKRFYRQYNIREYDEGVMPKSIAEFGNSSVATIPTLFDLVARENFKGHTLSSGDITMFASVGAGMNVNVVVYRVA